MNQYTNIERIKIERECKRLISNVEKKNLESIQKLRNSKTQCKGKQITELTLDPGSMYGAKSYNRNYVHYR